MRQSVNDCDVFVPLLTKHSLYLDQASDQPQPAVQELKKAFRRERLEINSKDRLIIVPVSCGLGDRESVARIVREATGEDLLGLWTVPPSHDTSMLSQEDAREVAEETLRAYMGRLEIGPPVSMAVGTRGSGRSSRPVVVDGRRILGGRHRRPGSRHNWRRFHMALDFVVAQLEEVGLAGDVDLELSCHLSAAFATGRVFHQASRWRPVFRSAHSLDRLVPTREGSGSGLVGGLEPLREQGVLVVDVDLIGHDVDQGVGELIRTMGPLGARGHWTVKCGRQVSSDEMAKWAQWIGHCIRRARAEVRPSEIHVVLASPVEFAAALGHHMTALEADIVLYEYSGGYRPVLRLPGECCLNEIEIGQRMGHVISGCVVP